MIPFSCTVSIVTVFFCLCTWMWIKAFVGEGASKARDFWLSRCVFICTCDGLEEAWEFWFSSRILYSCVEFGFNWFPSAAGETTGRGCEGDRELPVVQGNSASPNTWAMVKQNCLWKNLTLLQSQQSLPSSQRKDVPFHTLVYISIGFAPLFIPLPSGTARSMDTNQDSCCFNDQERKELQRPCNSLHRSLGTHTITGGFIVMELSWSQSPPPSVTLWIENCL